MLNTSKNQTYNRSNIYKDIDFSFSRHPLTNDVAVKTDVNAINQSIKSLVNTNFYERLFRPDLGCNIRRILFEPADPITIADLRDAIKDTITNHERRVTLMNTIVEDNPERNSYNVRIVYKINVNDEIVALDSVLERLR